MQPVIEMEAANAGTAEHLDERFLSIEKRMEQGFAHAEKAREQGYCSYQPPPGRHEQRFDDFRNTMLMLYIPVAPAILGTVVTYLFLREHMNPSPTGAACSANNVKIPTHKEVASRCLWLYK